MSAYSDEYIRKLIDENRELCEKVEYLKSILYPSADSEFSTAARTKLGLTRTQSRLLELLFKRNIVSVSMLDNVLPLNRSQGYKSEASRMHLSLTSRKMKKFGISIMNIKGIGYTIDDDDKKKIAQIIR